MKIIIVVVFAMFWLSCNEHPTKFKQTLEDKKLLVDDYKNEVDRKADPKVKVRTTWGRIKSGR